MTFKEKLSNYWYYYKWHTVAGVFLLLVLLISLSDCANRKDPDFTFAYVSYDYTSTDEIKNDISDFLGDINGDGVTYVYCDNIIIPREVKSQEDMVMSQKLMLSFVDGKTALYIMDDDFYDMYADGFEDLEKILPSEILKDAYEYNGKKVAVNASNCPKLEKYGLSRNNLYVGIMAHNDKDESKNKDYQTSVKLIKELTK